jgi:hypothetical protein
LFSGVEDRRRRWGGRREEERRRGGEEGRREYRGPGSNCSRWRAVSGVVKGISSLDVGDS